MYICMYVLHNLHQFLSWFETRIIKRILLLVKMKKKKLLKIPSLPKMLRAQAIRATTLNIYNCCTRAKRRCAMPNKWGYNRNASLGTLVINI